METNLKDFYSGDLYNFFVKNKDYDASYNCKVILTKDKHKYELIGSYNVDKFEFTLLPEVSATYADGYYKVFVLFSKTNFQKTENIGFINILPNILDSNQIEVLSYNKKMLIAIEDILAGRMQDDYDSYTIGNRSITKMKVETLLKLRDDFKQRVDLEDNRRNGKNKNNKIYVQWIGRFN